MILRIPLFLIPAVLTANVVSPICNEYDTAAK